MYPVSVCPSHFQVFLQPHVSRRNEQRNCASPGCKRENTPWAHLLWVKLFNCEDQGGTARIYFKGRAKKQKSAVGTLDTILPHGILSSAMKGPRKICLFLLSFVTVSSCEVRKSKQSGLNFEIFHMYLIHIYITHICSYILLWVVFRFILWKVKLTLDRL